MAEPAFELRAIPDNPFCESRLGYRLWAKGWRPVKWENCPHCGTAVEIVFKVGADAHCSNSDCRKTVIYRWEHPQYPTPLAAFEIFRRIVLKQWGVDINDQGEYRYVQEEAALSESEIETLKLERQI